MQKEQTKPFTIKKFADLLNHCFYPPMEKPLGVRVYFKASEAYRNIYEKICIKPLILSLYYSKYNQPQTMIKGTLCHSDILNTFEAQPLIIFYETDKRQMPHEKNKIYYLDIDLNKIEITGASYYPSEIHLSTKSIDEILEYLYVEYHLMSKPKPLTFSDFRNEFKI